jgi:deoxyadenosine/deoxycytidine kinase
LKIQGKVWSYTHISGIHLLDHGIFQTLRSINQKSQMRNISVLSEKLLNHAPQPNLVIIVEASADTILGRRLGREKKVGSSSLSNMIKNLSRLEEDKIAILQVAERINGMEVMSVSNNKDDDHETMAILIADTIEKCVQKIRPISFAE